MGKKWATFLCPHSSRNSVPGLRRPCAIRGRGRRRGTAPSWPRRTASVVPGSPGRAALRATPAAPPPISVPKRPPRAAPCHRSGRDKRTHKRNRSSIPKPSKTSTQSMKPHYDEASKTKKKTDDVLGLEVDAFEGAGTARRSALPLQAELSAGQAPVLGRRRRRRRQPAHHVQRRLVGRVALVRIAVQVHQEDAQQVLHPCHTHTQK